MSEELPPLPSIPFGASLGDILGKVQMGNDLLTQQNSEAATKPPKVTIETDDETGKPITTISNIDHESLSQVMQALNFQKQAMAGYQEELGRLNQQEQNLSHGMGPIFNALATVGGNLAVADPRLPPVVRALGQSAKDLNPTLRQVQRDKLGVLGAIGGQAQEMGNTGLAIQREERLDKRMQEQTDIQNKGLDVQLAQFRATERERILDNVRPLAAAGTLTKEIAANAKKKYMAAGGSLADGNAVEQDLLQQNQAALESKPFDKVQKSEKGPDGRMHDYLIYVDPKTQKEKGRVDVGLKEPTMAETLAGLKRNEEEKAIEEAAQRGASDDPDVFADPKQMASTRNLSLLKIYNRIGEIKGKGGNPANLAAKTKTFAFYTEGPGASALQSLGQWTQHAAQFTDAIERLNNLDSQWMNKPINEIKEKFAGDPLISKALVSADVAALEFQKFVISAAAQSNRALYESDREDAKGRLNANMKAGAALAAVQQMGETAQAITSEMENKWDRQFPGHPIKQPFSPQTHAAAKKLGIKLPGAPEALAAPPLSPQEQKIVDDFKAGKISKEEAIKMQQELQGQRRPY
jgi:translation initiation factor 1 (eIF-1/SUI1)